MRDSPAMPAGAPDDQTPGCRQERNWGIEPQVRDLRNQGLWRELRTLDSAQGTVIEQEGRQWLNFSSNDYLGFAASAELKVALHEGVERYGAGGGASRLVCGTLRPHAELESAVAAFKKTEAALTFSSGYAVALGTIPALVGAGDTVILDKLCHASLVDGARLSGATIRVFPHNQLGKLGRLLQSATGRVLVVTESIFSMDGDACALEEIVELKERHGAWLMLDEAHAVGVIGPEGRGLAAAHGLEGKVEVQMGTFSKSLGLSGGYVAAAREVVDLLINRARSFIYSTAPPPCIAHAAKCALEIVAGPEGDRRRERLWSNIELLKGSVRFPPETRGAILPLIIGGEVEAVEMSARLRESGLLIPAIRYPTVARGRARLRIALSAAHEPAQVQRLAAALTH